MAHRRRRRSFRGFSFSSGKTRWYIGGAVLLAAAAWWWFSRPTLDSVNALFAKLQDLAINSATASTALLNQVAQATQQWATASAGAADGTLTSAQLADFSSKALQLIAAVS